MLSRKVEDYLEAILISSEKKGYARPRDIVKAMDIQAPSVTEMLKKLSSEGLVEYERYGEIKLTTKGETIAKRIKKRHEVLEDFLKIIYVSDDIAGKDACIMEHHLNSETIEKLSKFVNFVHEFEGSQRFFRNFRKFCLTGKIPEQEEVPKRDNYG